MAFVFSVCPSPLAPYLLTENIFMEEGNLRAPVFFTQAGSFSVGDEISSLYNGCAFTLYKVLQATHVSMAIFSKVNRLIIYATIKGCKIRGNGLATILMRPEANWQLAKGNRQGFPGFVPLTIADVLVYCLLSIAY